MNLPPGKPLFHGSYEYTAYTPDQIRWIEKGIRELKKKIKKASSDFDSESEYNICALERDALKEQLKEAKKDSEMLNDLIENSIYNEGFDSTAQQVQLVVGNSFREPTPNFNKYKTKVRLAIQNAMKGR